MARSIVFWSFLTRGSEAEGLPVPHGALSRGSHSPLFRYGTGMTSVFPFLLALLAAGQALAQTVPPPPETVAPVAETPQPLPITERALGRADAPVRIDVYLSFICVECATWWDTVLPELKGRYIEAGQARLVFHDVAIEPAQHSVRASMIGLCADPARFFDVADAFMGGLAAAREDPTTVPVWYETAIAATGKPAEEIEACLGREAVYEQVRAQNSTPEAAALTGLPGVRVNGRPLPDASLQSIASAVLFAPPLPEGQ